MPKKETMKRINTRITPTQQKYLKAMAKREGISEGETFRVIMDFYINANK